MSLPSDPQARKGIPMAEGLLWYFPDALAAVAEVSRIGNEQHSPGEPMHWARGKSMDHADCIVRHLVDAGKLDKDGVRHTAKLAWRALALLQEELEKAFNLPLPRNAREEKSDVDQHAESKPVDEAEPDLVGAEPVQPGLLRAAVLAQISPVAPRADMGSQEPVREFQQDGGGVLGSGGDGYLPLRGKSTG